MGDLSASALPQDNGGNGWSPDRGRKGQLMHRTYEKADVLDSLLNVHRWAMELFDAVEADQFAPTKKVCDDLAGLIRVLNAAHQGFVFEYAMSGRAADDMLDGIRRDLGKSHG